MYLGIQVNDQLSDGHGRNSIIKLGKGVASASRGPARVRRGENSSYYPTGGEGRGFRRPPPIAPVPRISTRSTSLGSQGRRGKVQRGRGSAVVTASPMHAKPCNPCNTTRSGTIMSIQPVFCKRLLQGVPGTVGWRRWLQARCAGYAQRCVDRRCCRRTVLHVLLRSVVLVGPAPSI